MKIIRVTEIASCSILQSYYIVPFGDNDISRVKEISEDVEGFEDEKAIKVAEAFTKNWGESNSVAEIFDKNDIDNYPLLSPGPIFVLSNTTK